MSKIQEFFNEKFGKVRFVTIDGKPYAVASDIAKMLGYKNISRDVQRHCKNIRKHLVDEEYQNGTSHKKARKTQEMLIIPEGDIYRLIFKSKLREAEKIEEWVMNVVLPAVRMDGMYVDGEENIETPEELEAKVEECLKQKIIRKYGKISTRKLDAIMKKEWGFDGNKCGRLVNDLIYVPMFGRTSKQLKKETNVTNLRDEYFSIEELNMIRNAEAVIIALIKHGHTYEEVRKYMMEEHKAIREKNLQVKFAM